MTARQGYGTSISSTLTGEFFCIRCTRPGPSSEENVDNTTLGNENIKTSQPSQLIMWTDIEFEVDADDFETLNDAISGLTPSQRIQNWTVTYPGGKTLNNYWGNVALVQPNQDDAETSNHRSSVRGIIRFCGNDGDGVEVEPSYV